MQNFKDNPWFLRANNFVENFNHATAQFSKLAKFYDDNYTNLVIRKVDKIKI
ncbi:MAG: hypothetical protein KGD57_07225 [Candidatus Lokiarchaeota archaeon]|nr:hypothetical protein [Candidatus Lokiarchaeota archaeon]